MYTYIHFIITCLSNYLPNNIRFPRFYFGGNTGHYEQTTTKPRPQSPRALLPSPLTTARNIDKSAAAIVYILAPVNGGWKWYPNQEWRAMPKRLLSRHSV